MHPSLSPTSFSLCIGAGALLWAGSAALLSRRRVPGGAVWQSACLMLLFSLLFGRLSYCAAHFDVYCTPQGLPRILRLWEGGFALFPAYIGAWAGLALSTCRRKPAHRDALYGSFAFGAILFFFLVILARSLAGEGWGKVCEVPKSLQNTPAQYALFVTDRFGDTRYDIRALEALGATIPFSFCLCRLFFGHPPRRNGFLHVLGLLACITVVTASMREGQVLRVEFVRVEQLSAMVLLILRCLSLLRQKEWGQTPARAIALLCIGVGMCVWMEFLVDQEGHMHEKYLLMLAFALLCAAAPAFSAKKPLQRPARRKA